MADKANVAAFPYFQALFDLGAIGGLTDRQLLERFVERAGAESELAFEVLVARHGSMVHQICRSILDDPNDADDAFQATFLVLATRAGSLHIRDSICPWLHEVARRTAACARAAAKRRRRHELAAANESRHASCFTIQQHDLARILDDEVNRIPQRYRIAITLCLVEGLTHRQAAQRLNWPMGTVQSRLARGRALLRGRLTRRGIVPGALVTAEAALRAKAERALPAALVRSTVEVVTRSTLSGGRATTMAIASLAAQVLNAMFVVRLTMIVTPAFLLGLLCVAGAFRARQAPAGQAPPAAAAPAKPVDQKTETGRAVEPYRLKLVAPGEVKATTGRGKFLVFSLDESARRNQANGVFEEKLEERRWVVVTGVLDHDAIQKSLGLAAALAQRPRAASAKAQPDYRRLDVERQDRRPQSDWSPWALVDPDKNFRVLANVPEVEIEDRIPEQLRPAALVDPLPFLKDGHWSGADVERLHSSKKEVDSPLPIAKGLGRGGRKAIPPIEAPEIMVRSLDFTVERGLTYRYRVRVVIDSTDQVGRRREVLGPWSEPTAPVTISE